MQACLNKPAPFRSDGLGLSMMFTRRQAWQNWSTRRCTGQRRFPSHIPGNPGTVPRETCPHNQHHRAPLTPSLLVYGRHIDKALPLRNACTTGHPRHHVHFHSESPPPARTPFSPKTTALAEVGSEVHLGKDRGGPAFACGRMHYHHYRCRAGVYGAVMSCACNKGSCSTLFSGLQMRLRSFRNQGASSAMTSSWDSAGGD